MERPPLITFVVPVGNYHRAIAERAIQSVLAQSIDCSVIVVYDTDCKGAGWARNRGLELVSTPFVSFLDADDWLEPDYAETMLRAYDGARYVYTDWHASTLVQAPERVWDGTGAAHIVTTLLPTAFVRHVGGFDEALPGMEDTDLYWKLTRAGLCGKRLPRALVHYGKGGLRAQAFRDHPDRDIISKSIIERYEGMTMPCGGCGTGNVDAPNTPMNEPSPGDVLALSLWKGTRQERGRITGRLYRGGWDAQVWVAPQDIDATPHLFARVVEMPPPVDEAGLRAFRRVSAQLQEALGTEKAPPVQEPAPASAARGEVRPDVAGVLRLYGNVAASGE